MDRRADSPQGCCTFQPKYSTCSNVQQLALKDPEAGHVDPITGNYMSHDPAGPAIIQSRTASSTTSTPTSNTMADLALRKMKPNTVTQEYSSSIPVSCTEVDAIRYFTKFFEDDAITHPYENAFILVTELVNDFIEAKSSPNPDSYTWWDVLHKSMVSRDLSHAEKVSAFKNRLCTMLREPYEAMYASKMGEGSIKDKAIISSSPMATALVKSPLTEDEWIMLYDEEMCDQSLYPRADSKQALYSNPLSNDFMSVMEATANEIPKRPSDNTILEAVEELQLEQSDTHISEGTLHGPLRVQNPDNTSEEDYDSTQNYENTDTPCKEVEGDKNISFTSSLTSLLQSQSSAGIKSIEDDISEQLQRDCDKLSTQPLFLEQSPQMMLRINSLDRHAWTEVMPRLKGMRGQEIASQKEWTRHLRVVQKTLYTGKDDILTKWAGHAPPPPQLYYENIEPALGQPTPAAEAREELGIVDYMSWTLTTPKFVGKGGAPLGPEAEWDELSRLVKLKSGQLSVSQQDSVSVQDTGLVSEIDQPDLSQSKQAYLQLDPLLSSQDEGNLRIVQLRMEKLEAMRDYDFVDWMRTFGPQLPKGKASPLSITTSERFDKDGVYTSPLQGRELVMQHALDTLDYEIEYGTMYRADPIDAKGPHPEDPDDAYLPLTFGSAWDLEESKAEAYQRLRRLGEHGWPEQQRLILIALISHAKYIKKRGLINGIGCDSVIQAKPRSAPNWFLWLTECKHANLSLQACENIHRLAACFKDKMQPDDLIEDFNAKCDLGKRVIPIEPNDATSNVFWDRARQLYETDRITFYATLVQFGITKTGEEEEKFIGEIPQLFYPQLETFPME
jgi:hypothetical protein